MSQTKVRKVRHESHTLRFLAEKDKTARFREAQSALSRLLEEEGMNTVNRAVATAIAMARSEAFARRHGVTVSPSEPCIWRLVKGRCSHRDYTCSPPHDDHPALWLKGGKPHLYTSEFYDLGGDRLRELLAFADANGLDITIRADGMYFPGITTLVVYSRSADRPNHRKS